MLEVLPRLHHRQEERKMIKRRLILLRLRSNQESGAVCAHRCLPTGGRRRPHRPARRPAAAALRRATRWPACSPTRWSPCRSACASGRSRTDSSGFVALCARERSDPELSRVVSGDGTCVLLDTEQHPAQAFYYDHVFWSVDPADPLYHDQKQVYESVAAPLLKSTFEGYNVCLLAYGQTGSGKTHSMMGRLSAADAGPDELCDKAGVIPRFCVDLFQQTAACSEYQTTVQVSYYEIYQERIRDLLSASDEKRSALRVREHPTQGPHVVGLTAVPVDGWPLMRSLMDQGNRLRATASTGMNNKSSRSHSVLTLIVTRTQTETVDGEQLESQQTAHVNLVDLAGSERVAQAQTTGVRLKEGVVINKSLLTLGKVIMALVDGGRAHIPYRESVLTWLLKESLGGNSRTAMLATISPCSAHVEETLSTLRYACKTNQIVNSVHVNEDPRARIIRELRAEVERLRQEQTLVAPPSGDPGKQSPSASATDSPNALRHRLAITQLKRKLQQKELQLRSQNSELEEAKRRLAEGETVARPAGPPAAACGVPFVGHVSQPSLVNLLPDPALTETVAFPLPEGDATLGAASTATVRLHGLMIDKVHCSVTRSGCRATLHPVPGCVAAVNGSEVTTPTALQHGDRLVLAGEVFLRFHLPAHPLLGLRDFADAKAELDRKNEERAAQEQERLRERVKQELLQELHEDQEDAELERHTQQIQLEQQIDSLRQQLEQLRAGESRRPAVSVPSPADSSSLNVSLFHSDLLEQIEGVFRDSTGSGSNWAGGTQSAAQPAEVSPAAARLSQLVTEGNALFRRLNKKVTLTSDLELSGGELRPVAMVTDGEHGVCTSWNLQTMEDKVAALRALWEERDSSSCSSVCDISAVLDSRSGWRQQQERRRSGRLTDDGGRRRRSSIRGRPHGDGEPEDISLALATYCSPLVHECVDWRTDGVRSVLLCVQSLNDSLDRVDKAWHSPVMLRSQEDFAQALVDLLSRWCRLSSAFAVWRRWRLASDETVQTSVAQLDDVLDRLQNAIGFVYQGIGGRVSSLTEDHLAGCRQLTVRLCRLLGTAAEELTDPDEMTEGLTCDTLSELSAGTVMALDHLMVELIRSCEDAEVLITGLVDDSVSPDSTDAAGLYSAAHELVACLRSWLQRGRSLQTAAAVSESDASAGDPAERTAALRRRVTSTQQACGWVTALSSAVRLILLSVDRHHKGASLDRSTLCDAVRKLLHSCRRLTPALSAAAADAGLRQGRSELAAAAGALLYQLDAADESASTVLSGASDGSRRARTPDATMFGSLLDSPAAAAAGGDGLSPLPADQMAARLRQAVTQLERSPSKSSLRSRDSPVKGRVQFRRPAVTVGEQRH